MAASGVIAALPPAALWVKVVARAPSSVTLDADYAPLACALSATAHALKKAVIAARGAKLTGVAPEDLRVYHRGASEAAEGAEAAFIASPRDHLPADSELCGVVGASLKAFFLVTASLPAGARARARRSPSRAHAPSSLSTARSQAMARRLAAGLPRQSCR